jgi:hypothetical protein
VLAKAGIRRIRLHDLRHTFGSLLLQNGASIVYVKEQMGHSSIHVTVDTYGHLIPCADVCFVDRLDGVGAEEAKTSPQQSATPAQPGEMEVPPDLLQVIEEIGGGGRTRTYDLRIMRCAFRRAATWIQSLAIGPRELARDRVQAVGA